VTVRRRVAALLLLGAAAAALAGCGSAHQSAASLQTGQYSGTLPNGAPVTVSIGAGSVQVDGHDAYLVDPTTTAQFLVTQSTGAPYFEWSCTQTEAGRSMHCETWLAPHAEATPTALPCVSPGPDAPAWCRGGTHVAVDLLRICSNPGC
jgi:hypothetical protein